jgi:hypothetical protein
MTAIAHEWLSAGAFSENRICSQVAQLARRGLPTERNYFYRDRSVLTQVVNDFSLINDDYQPLAGVGHNLLPQECTAKAFDQVQISGLNFVGAVDRDIDLRIFSERSQRDFQGSRLCSRSLRSRDTDDAKPFPDPSSQRTHRKNRRGAASQANDHSVSHLIHRRLCGGLFPFIQLVSHDVAKQSRPIRSVYFRAAVRRIEQPQA